ncbi:MAG: hypothetical protein IJN43_00880 [Ruminococcus sp.]|nr:hypothetical protein [Ruminococcus sp.]
MTSCPSGACTSHWIMENALMELVRNDLEQYVKGLEVSEEQLQWNSTFQAFTTR